MRSLPAHAQDVVERIAAAGVRARVGTATAESTQGPAERTTESAAAEDAAEDAAEPTADAPASAGTRTCLPGHVASQQHREHGEHLLEDRGLEPGLRGGVLSDAPAHVLGAEDVAQ